MFDFYRSVENTPIKLPNSQTIPIIHIGEVHISPIFILHNAHMHHILHNIISVNRLLLHSPYSLLFRGKYCII